MGVSVSAPSLHRESTDSLIMSSCRTEMLNDIGMIMLEIKHSMQAEPGGDRVSYQTSPGI